MLLPPKIDDRTYEDIVKQTLKLAQHFTARDEVELVDNKPEALRDRTLAEEIAEADGKILSVGTLIDEQLAVAIANLKTLKKVKVKVKGWCQAAKPDPGLALIRIFSRMATLAIARLNQVPEKNFLAFLDLLGTQILPPQPAQVPLTFSLVDGVPDDQLVVVPAGTQVAAPPVEGDAEEVVFETERDLALTTSQLQALFVRQPDTDRYSECQQKDTAFRVFVGEQAIAHYLYIACDPLLTIPAAKNVTLKINLFAPVDSAVLASITWSYWDGSSWQPLSVTPTVNNNLWSVAIANIPVPTQLTINEVNAAWLRAEFTQPLTENSVVQFGRILASAQVVRNAVAAELCFYNGTAIDLSKDFYPFDEQPYFNDTFYLAIDEACAKPRTQVTVDVKLSDAPPMPVNPSADLNIQWEVWNGNTWESVKNNNFRDRTQNFTKSEKISLTLPAKVEPTTVGGENGYWVRARIVKGNYGTETATQLTTFAILTENAVKGSTTIKVNSLRGFMPNDNLWLGSSSDREEASISSLDFTNNIITLKAGLTKDRAAGTSVLLRSTTVFGPPSVKSLALSYTYNSDDTPLSACQTYNDFQYSDRQAEANQNNPWLPFTLTADKDPALYLGFDRPFANRAINLYAQVEPPQPEEVGLTNASATDTPPPKLVWEYATKQGWQNLGVQDETSTFAERGLMRFIGPSDFTAKTEFGKSLYWLRVRWENWQNSQFRVAPKLQGLLTNTTWAIQATSIGGEILGSSNGNPNQVFRSSQAPILLGQKLEIQESAIPSLEEQAALKNLAGKVGMTILRNDIGEIEAVWVLWQEVSDFYESGLRDRHYVVNHLTGEIQFGNGQQGMIPPQGRNNIRLSSYRTGGGALGNCPVNSIAQLKTTIPYLDRVTNWEPASGGAEQEPMARVQERGPKIIRHRSRAVTVQDFEDLAYEASPDLARVKAVPPICDPLAEELWLDPKNPTLNSESHQQLIEKANPGLVKLFLVPDNSSRQPIPSLALIERVENYIRDRASPTLNLWVGSPQWLQVSVTAEVAPTSFAVADTVRTAVIQGLETFLHPLTGGVTGQGWEFGREPHESDFYTLIKAIAGVDYVRSLSIRIAPEPPPQPEPFLIFSGNHTITLFLAEIGG
ncbi:MAG TPA: putative baseplate assembly protein [Cyanobacteria bacterium UBA8803]|nr:putative baseplate assembly protein [Cyanobacteria bacterium UBA9273]HBL62442.1 putative baseplate assembly protein [Cyanobacteria bacterium UBA8803]